MQNIEKNHPEKTINDIPLNEEIPLNNEIVVKLGIKLANIRQVATGTKRGIITEKLRKYLIKQEGLSLEK